MNALGRQVLAELHGISPDQLNDPALLERTLVASAQDAGATVVESSFNPFAPHGVTGIVIIQESHLALHTWPEHGYAALDIFTCSREIDPVNIATAFSEALGADRCDTQIIERGTGMSPSERVTYADHGTTKRGVWFTDRQDNIALSLRHAGVLFDEQSAYQRVEVLASDGYGKILLLDNQVAFTERDEFVYHELIAHVPALYHPGPKRVLIIGGGDGGACSEFLKHDTIEEVIVVEIDPTVTEAARDHFPHKAISLDDDRVTLVHGDGDAYLSSTTDTFDIVAVDCLDSAGDNPFDEHFLTRLKTVASPGGLVVTQVSPPTLSPERFRTATRSQQQLFATTKPYLGFLPTYSTGMLSFLLSSDNLHNTPRPISPDLGLKYLTNDLLSAAFALPAFIHEHIEE